MNEHPIVLIDGIRFVEYRPAAHCLNERQWQALIDAERPLYTHGDLGITDTSPREDCDIAADIWAYCEIPMDTMYGGDIPEETILRRIAERVARVFAVMAFGPEFLIR